VCIIHISQWQDNCVTVKTKEFIDFHHILFGNEEQVLIVGCTRGVGWSMLCTVGGLVDCVLRSGLTRRQSWMIWTSSWRSRLRRRRRVTRQCCMNCRHSLLTAFPLSSTKWLRSILTYNTSHFVLLIIELLRQLAVKSSVFLVWVHVGWIPRKTSYNWTRSYRFTYSVSVPATVSKHSQEHKAVWHSFKLTACCPG